MWNVDRVLSNRTEEIILDLGLILSFCVQYLDENMQLIIATLYKQNQSNLNESALYVSNSRHLICQQNFMKAWKMSSRSDAAIVCSHFS